MTIPESQRQSGLVLQKPKIFAEAFAKFLMDHQWRLWVFSTAILFFRSPGSILRAEFWAEDGSVWYADAYNKGFASLFIPHAGYLQSVPRLVALAAQTLPIRWGPTFFALVALVIQAAPAVFLMSRRMTNVWPNRSQLLLVAFIYLIIPNSQEVLLNITNSQWHLACLSFLILACASNKLIDLATLAISGLSGPFCLLLVPIAAWNALTLRTSRWVWHATIITGCASVQSWMLLTTMNSTRTLAPLGADIEAFCRIIALQIFVASLVGTRIMSKIADSSVWSASAFLPICISVIGLSLVAAASWRGPLLIRKSVAWGSVILFAALLRPQVSTLGPQWAVLTLAGSGNRYFFVPMLSWLCACLSLTAHPSRFLRLVAAVLLSVIPLGVIGDWQGPQIAAHRISAQSKGLRACPKWDDFRVPGKAELVCQDGPYQTIRGLSAI